MSIALNESNQMTSVNAVSKPIRYGEAPVGNLRWKAPVLVTDYQDPVQGHLDEQPMCSQPNPGKAGSGGGEDCLFLQVQVQKSVLENKEKKSGSLLHSWWRFRRWNWYEKSTFISSGIINKT